MRFSSFSKKCLLPQLHRGEGKDEKPAHHRAICKHSEVSNLLKGTWLWLRRCPCSCYQLTFQICSHPGIERHPPCSQPSAATSCNAKFNLHFTYKSCNVFYFHKTAFLLVILNRWSAVDVTTVDGGQEMIRS